MKRGKQPRVAPKERKTMLERAQIGSETARKAAENLIKAPVSHVVVGVGGRIVGFMVPR